MNRERRLYLALSSAVLALSSAVLALTSVVVLPVTAHAAPDLPSGSSGTSDHSGASRPSGGSSTFGVSGTEASDAAPAEETVLPTSIRVSAPVVEPSTRYILGRAAPVSATVSAQVPDTGEPPTGIVEFFDGATSLGSVELLADEDTATLETDRWPVSGARQITATFTPEDGTAYAPSESAPRIYRIVDLSRVVPDIEPDGTVAAELSDATLEWTIANIWFSNFQVGFERQVMGGDVTLPDLPVGTTIPEKQAYYSRPFTFAGGTGMRDGAGNRVISYEGSVRLTSGSANRWDVTDPEIRIGADGRGYLTAEFSGFYALSAEETYRYGPVRVAIATFSEAVVEDDGAGRKTASIDLNWEGQANGAGSWALDYDASFPNEFVALLHPAIALFFASSGVSTDASKQPLPITVGFTETADEAPVQLPFTDVKRGDQFFTQIAWMYSEGLSTGVRQSDGSVKYVPKGAVSREAMAAFLYRLAGKPSFSAPSKSPFADLRPSDKFYKEITWLADQGITTGVKQASGKPKFFAKDRISREAMAAFLYRFEGKPSYSVPSVSYFADVKKGDPFYKEISWMFAEGITTGVKQSSGKPKYLAKNSVTREAMAAFIYRSQT